MGSKKTIKISIPKDVHVAWERDFSFLGCYLIAEQHLVEMKRYIGVGYSMCAFFHDRSHVVFYRSEADEENFDSGIATRLLKERGYAKHVTDKLRKLTDEFGSFFKKERKLSRGNIKKFFRTANEHFSFHLAVFWSADYIVKNDLRKKNRTLYKLLEKARKYNEHILPDLENWIAKQDPIISLLRPRECEKYVLRGKKPSVSVLKARQKSAFVYFDEKNRYLLTGKQAVGYKKKYDEAFLRRHLLSENAIKGRPVFPGRYKGRVRVIERFEDFRKIKKGEVLVAPITRPAYNIYIRKAGAIVVDEGAILSHASILARELKIPCIIGTKIATKVLKNGDLVEVDADKGIVKIIKEKK